MTDTPEIPLAAHVAVNALREVEILALDLYYEEKNSYGNYDDAAKEAVRYAIKLTADLMEPTPTNNPDHVKISELYWNQVNS